MKSARITQIPAGAAIAGADQFLLWQDGRTRANDVSDLLAFLQKGLRGEPGETGPPGQPGPPGTPAPTAAQLVLPGNPVGDALAGKLGSSGGTYPSAFSYKGSYWTVNARSLFTSDADTAANWLGDSAGGSATSFAYGGTAEIVALSGIGDVGIVGATRTDLTPPGQQGRLPIGVIGWAFNFKTDNPKTAWGGYFEARRKKGAGQIHGLEVNVTDLGDGSDRIIPSAIKSGANAVYSPYASGVNIAAGGNVTTRQLEDGTIVQQQLGWDGEKNVTQAANAGSAIAIYANGSRFEKGIIIGEDACVGANGTGLPNVGTGLEMGRGTQIAWIDGSTRFGAVINSNVSPSGAGQRMLFNDFGVSFDCYGQPGLIVSSKPTDVIGLTVTGGTAAEQVRLIARGASAASLSLEVGADGGIFIPGIKNAANDAAAATAGVPVGAIYRNGSALMIRQA